MGRQTIFEPGCSDCRGKERKAVRLTARFGGIRTSFDLEDLGEEMSSWMARRDVTHVAPWNG